MESPQIPEVAAFAPFQLLRDAGLDVEVHPKKGRFVRATKDISSGTIIFTQKPYVHSFTESDLNRCHNCLQYFATTMRCSSCRSVRYCARKCQAADWGNHKTECAYISRLPADGRTGTAVLSLRLLRRWNDEMSANTSGSPTRAILGSDTASDVLAMHPVEVETGLEESSESYAATLAHALNQPAVTTDVIKDLLNRTLRNSFAISDQFNDEMARGIFPSASIFNHSCRPNAWAYFDNKMSIRITAIRSIKKGDEICVSYTNGFDAPQTRRIELRRSFGFWCECSLCANEPKTTETDITQIIGCETCNQRSNRNLDCSSEEQRNNLSQLQADIKRLATPTPESHDFLHFKSYLQDAFYLARTLRDHLLLIKLGIFLRNCHDYLELPIACPSVFLTHYQIGLSYMSLLSWKKARTHLDLAMTGMGIARSPLLWETGNLVQMTAEPTEFVQHATILRTSPSLSPAVEELLATLNDNLTSPEFGFVS